ncbi:MAG: T9SS type A sorting domain-containing protein [Paludibacteraceae bacterium]|nr:T9SS type A sorting domain-containing protein [Paludibacteraceae bacterium]
MKKSLLFTIVMALLCLFGNVKAQTPGSFTCPEDAWEWNANGTTTRWDEPLNWTAPKNGAPVVSGVAEQFPGQLTTNDKVYIPNTNANKNGKYPVMDATINVSAIYLESGAMLGNQFHLNATTWYTDITVPTNRWILVSSPLRGTYSGDFYTTTQGGTYAGPFAPAVYDGQAGGSTDGIANRKFPFVIYERLFSNASSIRYAAYDIEGFESTWNNPTNALAYQFQPGEAVQILARGRGAAGETETFHFPASDTEYYYFNSNGQITTLNGQQMKESGISREQSGRPVYNASSMTIKLTRNIPTGCAPSTYWAVGNPAFASLDIEEFLKENERFGYTTPYVYKHEAADDGCSPTEAIGKGDVVFYYNRLAGKGKDKLSYSAPTGVTTEPYINTGRGFRIEKGNGTYREHNHTEILGEYTMSLDLFPINWRMRMDESWFDGFFVRRWAEKLTGTTSNEENLSNLSNNFNITISQHPNNINKVYITNFAGIANTMIEATIDENNQNIIIAGGTIVVDNPSSSWTAGSGANTTNDKFTIQGRNPSDATFTLHGNQYSSSISQNIRSNQGGRPYEIQTQYVSNVSESNDVIIHYDIDQETHTVTLSTTPFAIYPTNKDHYYYKGITWHSESSLTGGQFSIGNLFCSTWNCFNSYTGNKSYTPTTNSTGQASDELTLVFTEKMFNANNRSNSQKSPKQSASLIGDLASISTTINNLTFSTLINRNEDASNNYFIGEDAAILSDFDEEKLSLGTLAGKTRVAVNTLNDTTRCQIVLTGVNGDVDLVFDNLDALGENVRLFDANDSTYTPLNGNHATTTVTFGVNDSPLRYSLVWDYTPIIAGNETLTAIDFTAFSPAKGEVKVMSNELLKGVRVYNAAGQLITSNNANANEVSFSNLLSGIYVIEAYTANGKATKKVDVK